MTVGSVLQSGKINAASPERPFACPAATNRFSPERTNGPLLYTVKLTFMLCTSF